MNLRNKMLFATLLASSGLILTTQSVKAETTKTDSQINQSITQSSNQSIQENPTTLNGVSRTNSDVSQERSQTINSAEVSTQNPRQQESDEKNSNSQNMSSNAESAIQNNAVEANNSSTQATQSQPKQNQQTIQTPQTVKSEQLDGVYTVGDTVTYLYYADGSQVKNRALAPKSAWYTDTCNTKNDGSTYYRVSTLEFARGDGGTYQSYVHPFQGDATVVYRTGSSIHSFTGYGDRAVYQGTDLPTGSNWKVNNHAKIGGKEWYQIGNNVWIPQDNVVINNGQYQDADWVYGVPLISQRPELPNGCEITAVTMMLHYAGANVNKMQLAQEMPRNSDPNYGYIGQPWDATGITIFPSALMGLVEKYAGTAKNLTGQGLDAIKYQINLGHPVVTWNTLHGFPYHALVVTGYDKNYIYYNDCWTNQSTRMGINQFISNWNTQNRRAISY